MSSWWQSRTGQADNAKAWLDRGRAAVGAARILVDQGFLPEAVELAGIAISHGSKAALEHEGRSSQGDVAAEFEAALIRSRRLDPRFLEVLREAQAWRARTAADPQWTPPGEEARVTIARATSFLSGVQALLESG